MEEFEKDIIIEIIDHFITTGWRIQVSLEEIRVFKKYLKGCFSYEKEGTITYVNKIGNFPPEMEILYWKDLAEFYQQQWNNLYTKLERALHE